MSEMVERVAFELQAKAVECGNYSDNIDWNALARTAIAAMREPTEAMIEASNRDWDGRMSHRSSGAWQAMIDEALNTTRTK